MGNNRNEVRVRGNAHQLLEKYKQLARDASMQGDRVSAEYYMQYADHYYRVLNEFRMRQEEQQARQQGNNPQRGRDDRDERDAGNDYDDDGDDDDMMDNAGPIRVSEMTRMVPEPQADAPRAKGGERADNGEGSDDAGGSSGNAGGDAEGEASEGEEGAPRRRRARSRRPRRDTADEGELAPADA